MIGALPRCYCGTAGASARGSFLAEVRQTLAAGPEITISIAEVTP